MKLRWFGLVLLCALPAQAAAPGQEPTLLAQIEAIDRRLVSAESALSQGEAQVRALDRAVADAESARAAAVHSFKAASRKLGTRLGALTRLGPEAQLVALTHVHSLSDLIDDQRLLGQVARHDRKLWVAHRAAQQQLEQTIALAQERAATLQEAQSRRRELRDTLASRRQRKDRLLKNLQRQKTQKALSAELQLARVQLGELVPENPAASGTAKMASTKSGLRWPATGRVRVAFGQQTEGLFGTSTQHNGWDIAAAAGSSVEAIAAGRVAYAQWLQGYGQVAIVEHPNGFHTVHAHLSKLAVRQGERVRAGQLLGAVGDTGSVRGTVLYFEIRHRGVPQDPRRFLARR